MDNSAILNPNEGKKVGELIWPFNRFSALIPNQIGGDIFIWLYMSLVVFVNETKNLSRDNYSQLVKMEVQKLINEKFSNIIDHQTLERIISNAEDQFVDKTNIKENTFSFIETYENLFSESCETRMVYQDAITGEVLPFFGDTSNIDDYRIRPEIDHNTKLIRVRLKDPSSKAIKKAYEQYMKLKRFNIVSVETEVELEDEFFDEEQQTFLENEIESISFLEVKKDIRSLIDMDVIPIQDTKVELNLLVSVYIKDNQLYVRSPFGKMTDNWLVKCLLKGRNISEDMDKKLNQLEQTYCIEEKKSLSYIETHRKDFASNLKYCQTIYRLLDVLEDDKIRKFVVDLDAKFKERDTLCYLYIGKILDRVVNKIQYSGKSTALERETTDFNVFCKQIDNKCENTSLNYHSLKSRNIFDDWKKKYKRKDGKEYMSFKADLTDIIMRTNLINSSSMYDSFINNLFELYSLRNAVSHDDEDKVVIDEEKLTNLTTALKVLIELI